MDADVIIVGAGLAGLTAAVELTDAGRKVIVVDQEPEQSLGGQAFWSLGGIFLVNTPEQRRPWLRIKDSFDLAWNDWIATAGFDREEDHWPREWARAYVEFASGEKRAWMHQLGHRFLKLVGWPERGGHGGNGPGNTVPRFHITWGAGPGVLEPFIFRAEEARKRGLLTYKFRHRVDQVDVTNGIVTGISGAILEPSDVDRGKPSSRIEVASFKLTASAVLITSGGIGGNHDLVRANWPKRIGPPPVRMLSGVPDYVDGRMLAISETAGGRVINRDRMWHYVEGLENWDSIWTRHGIRILPGPSSLWLDATGKRLPVPYLPGYDTLGTLHHLRQTGFDHSWFILTRKVIEKEFALSGSEQNVALTRKSITVMTNLLSTRIPVAVQAFMDHGADFIIEKDVGQLARRMNELTGETLIDPAKLQREIEARDAQLDHPYCKDLQINAIRNAHAYFGDHVARAAKLHKFLDPAAGPLIAVRLSILTRKSLGGLQTDLTGAVLRGDGNRVPGLYAAGEVAGFGGGGMHGYRALEGTFLGGCLFSGRTAARGVAEALKD